MRRLLLVGLLACAGPALAAPLPSRRANVSPAAASKPVFADKTRLEDKPVHRLAGWLKPTEHEVELRGQHTQTQTELAVLEPKLTATSATRTSKRQLVEQLVGQQEQLAMRVKRGRRVPFLRSGRDGLSKEAWEAGTVEARTQLNELEPKLALARGELVTATQADSTLWFQAQELQKKATQLDGELFDLALRRAPRELILKYEAAKTAQGDAERRSQSAWDDLRQHNVRYSNPMTYDYKGRDAIGERIHAADGVTRERKAATATLRDQIASEGAL